MRVSATIFNQNYGDWDRYEAEERGESVAPRARRADRAIFREELEIARSGAELDSHPWGTPDQTIKRATELAEAFGTDEIMFVFKYGSTPMAAAERSVRLFAREVMPALKELRPSSIAA